MNLKSPDASWEMFLQVLEDEVKFNESSGAQVSYISKQVTIEPPRHKNLSEPPTKFAFANYQVTFFERFLVGPNRCCLVLINNRSLMLMNEEMTSIHERINFSRDFGKQY